MGRARHVGRHVRAVLPTRRRHERDSAGGPPTGVLVLIGAVLVGVIALVAISAQRSPDATASTVLCEDATTISAPLSLVPLIDAYASQDGDCLAAAAASPGSSDVELTAGLEPPAANEETSQPIASSPVLLAMPASRAADFGYPDRALDAESLSNALSGETPLRLRIVDPEQSVLGATALTALVALLGDDSSALTALRDSLVVAPSDAALLPAATTETEFASVADGVLTTEAELIAYASSSEVSTVPLVGLVIGDGSAQVPVRIAGTDDGFGDFAMSDAGRESLREAGFYGAGGEAPTTRGPINAAVATGAPVLLTADELAAAPGLLPAAAQERDVVLLVDAADGLTAGLAGTTRQAALADAIAGVDVAGVSATASLWVSRADGARQVRAPQPVDADLLSSLGSDIETADPGSTDLTAAIRQTLGNAVVYSEEPDRELLVLVIVPAGAALSSADQASLLTYLRSTLRPDGAVRVSVLGVGGEVSGFDQVMATGRGSLTTATTPEELSAALADAFGGGPG